MIVSEEAAKARWCPFARVSGWVFFQSGGTRDMQIGSNQAIPVNRADVGDPEPRWPANAACIASNCMAWRWDRERNNGWCGLAGEPPHA